MKGTTIALVSCMFLSLEPIFSKELLNYGIQPMVLAALTSVFATIILFFILEVEHRVWEVFSLKRREYIVLLAVGIVSGVIAQFLYVSGLNGSTATNSILLTRLNSLLIAMFGVVLLGEKLRWNHVIGAVLMVIGIVIIATRNFTVSVRPTQGDGLLLLAAVCWAIANILMKKYLSHVPPEVIVIGYYGFSGVALTIASATQMAWVFTPTMIMYLAGLVILVSLIGRYLWYFSLEHTSAANVGLASLSIPLFGVVYAVTLLGESPQLHQVLGGTLIFIGLVVIEIHLLKHEDTHHRLKRHHPHH
jgi:drug/metabolite transporter (DMT)-like permease